MKYKYAKFLFSYSGFIGMSGIKKLPHGPILTPQKAVSIDWDTPIWVSQGQFTELNNYWFKIVLWGSKIFNDWSDKYIN